MDSKVARIFLHKNDIEICSSCSAYLSVGPIVLYQNKPVCARCPQEIGPQANFYEKLAEYMFFPCKNDIYGCDAMLAWGKVLEHENICKFNPLICPALHCKDKIEKAQLVTHFTIKHEDLVLKENHFKVPCRSGDEYEYINKLWIWRNKPFLLKINFSSPFCLFNILGFDEYKNQKFEYNLIVEDEKKKNKMFVKGIRISDYRIRHHDNLTMSKLDMDVLRTTLCSDDIICTFNIENGALPKSVLNNNLLAELECPICIEYLRPPIFMCALGHAICNSCKPKLVVCPTCQIAIENNRNFALEKITEHISYPCKYHDDGCSTIGLLSDIRPHEATCVVGAKQDLVCYVSYSHPCVWRGPVSKQMNHISLMHPEFFVDLQNGIQLDLKIFEKMNVYLERNNQIFKLKILYEKNKSIRICVKAILNSGKLKQYRFYIDFDDLNQNQRMLNLNKDCVSAHANDESFMDSLVISYPLYKPFMKHYKISFKIHILCMYFSCFLLSEENWHLENGWRYTKLVESENFANFCEV